MATIETRKSPNALWLKSADKYFLLATLAPCKPFDRESEEDLKRRQVAREERAKFFEPLMVKEKLAELIKAINSGYEKEYSEEYSCYFLRKQRGGDLVASAEFSAEELGILATEKPL